VGTSATQALAHADDAAINVLSLLVSGDVGKRSEQEGQVPHSLAIMCAGDSGVVNTGHYTQTAEAHTSAIHNGRRLCWLPPHCFLDH